MKTIVTFIFAFITTISFAQDKYSTAMLTSIQSVYSAKTPEDYQQAINSFDRIANAEKTKWEPYYYSAFGNVMLANQEKDATKKDAYLDLAMASVEMGEALAPKESELVAMEGFVHMIRITVDPATRGQKFSSQGMRALGKAISLNPENPRAYCLLAQMQFGTADFFGASTAEACGTIKTSLEKFETYKSDNPVAPRWGKEFTQGVAARCKLN